MKFLKSKTVLVTVCMVACNAAYSQSTASSATAAGKPTGKPPEAAPAAQALTAAELAKVKTILAPYTAAKLTADDAKIIKRTLRDAGMPKSRQLDAALVSLGFSPEKLDALDPPPPRPQGEGAPPPPSLPPAPSASAAKK